MEHYFTNNTNLRSEIRNIIYENKGKVFTFSSDLGVFSKDKVDFGSRVLVETILETEKEKSLDILDVGCGYGFIGIVLATFLESKIKMIDVNKRALHLCEKNLKLNSVEGSCAWSDGYENINEKYNLIVTNPPIRAGKEVVLRILKEAKDYLKEEGRLWFVIRKNQGAKSIIKMLETIYECNIVKKEKGFYIVIAKIH